mmetsp:Transcript_17141/g.34686  ORF Transcript_17141/g.34686 Transcript_17141/m.34686 type:complete len:271 (+) Transcript_17141:38-850(+)
MSSRDAVRKLLEEYKAQLKIVEKSPNNAAAVKKGKDILTQIKIAMLDFDIEDSLANDKKVAAEQLTLSRESLELATFFSVTVRDIKSFVVHITQVKVFYRDYSSMLLESARKWTILGLNLMYLLAHNKLSEFHTELELIPLKDRKNSFISFPIEVEQRLMEGSYSKVLIARKSVPSSHYVYFMELLMDTVRERISECSMKAYDSIPLSEGKKMLMLDSEKQLQEYAAKRGWKIVGADIHWSRKVEAKIELKSRDFVKESLGFATELERIV